MEKIFPIFVLIILCLKSELTNSSLVYIKQDFCFNEKFCSVKNSTCSMYLVLINRHFLLSSFKWKRY